MSMDGWAARRMPRVRGRHLDAVGAAWGVRKRRWFESDASYREALLRVMLAPTPHSETAMAWSIMEAIPAVEGVNITTEVAGTGFPTIAIRAKVAWWRRFVPGSRRRTRAAIVGLLPDIQPCGTAARVEVR